MRLSTALPDCWLLSDERNDRLLDRVLQSCAAPLAFVYRHYHLAPDDRLHRFLELKRRCLKEGHLVILGDSATTAREWGADGIYGAPRALYPRRSGLLRIATAHNMREIGQANRFDADAIMLSPVFPTRSHPGAPILGVSRFLMMAKYGSVPVIALGGMDARNSQQLRWQRWAAIDGLSTEHTRPDA